MVDSSSFRQEVERLVSLVPAGRVCTYGDVALAAGHPYAARIVGGIAHYGDSAVPWHRVVNRFGGLASGYHGGRSAQADMLVLEGVACQDDRVVDFRELRWLFNTQ